jgi:hypothetical protein
MPEDTTTTGLTKLDMLTVLLADRCEELTESIQKLQRLNARVGESPAHLRDAEEQIEMLTRRMQGWQTWAMIVVLLFVLENVWLMLFVWHGGMR